MATTNDKAATSAKHTKALRTVLIFTSIYLIAEVVGGILTGSLALIADAGHMLTDVAGLALALFAIWFGKKKATATHTYGFYRTEILASVINCLVLFGISIYILIEAYYRFRNPPEVQSGTMMIVAVIGLGVNIAGMIILRKSSGESLNMKGAYFEVLSDMLTSIGVIIAGVIMLLTGWWYADPILSALIGLLILPRTYKLLMEGVNVLMEGTPKDIDLEKLRAAILATEGIAAEHDLHVWTLTSGVNAVSAHLIPSAAVQSVADVNAIIKAVKAKLASDFGISHVTLEMHLDEKDYAPNMV